MNINHIVSTDKTHYIKFKLKHDISVRYHYTWMNNKSNENKWILKDHQNKLLQVIEPQMAMRLIEDLCDGSYEEIMGSTINGSYVKRVITRNGKHVNETIDDSDLEKKHFKRISKKLWRKKDGALVRMVGAWEYKIGFLVESGDFILSITKPDGSVDSFCSEDVEDIKKEAMLKMSPTKEKAWFPSTKRLNKLHIS